MKIVRLLRKRRWLVEAIHGFLIGAALLGSFLLRFDFVLPPFYRRQFLEVLPIVLGVKLTVFTAFQLRHLAWRHVGMAELFRLARAVLVASAASTVVIRVWIGPSYPRSLCALDLLLCLAFLGGVRLLARVITERETRRLVSGDQRNVLIYGAGEAGVAVLREIQSRPGSSYRVVGFLDDDRDKWDLRIHGVRVLGAKADLHRFVTAHQVHEILIAMPSATGSKITEILAACHAAGVRCKTIPGLSELIDGKNLVRRIRDVNLEDLLGRPPVRLFADDVRTKLRGRVVLVTGAGGSIGSELCRQIAQFEPAALVALDCAETALYEIDQEIRDRFPGVAFFPEVGNIQNPHRLAEVLSAYSPAVLYHAAAYKHVPMMEAHVFEAFENNVVGTLNVARAAVDFGVEDFVLISSDKAVRPANVMGATKRMAELIGLSMNGRGTRFMTVRFGNVLGSNGSVIPLFLKQIAAGGPVTVTDPTMRRYFMTIPEAALLVLQASAMGQGGEIFVLDMGEPVQILDLARNLILLSGFRPEEDIRIAFTGIRPGEKLYEELSAYEEDTVPTPHEKIRIFLGKGPTREELTDYMRRLREVCATRDMKNLVLGLKEVVPEYNPSAHILRRALKQPEPDPKLALSTT